MVPPAQERMLAEVFFPPSRLTRAMLLVLAFLPGWRAYEWVRRWSVDRSLERYRRLHH